MGGTSYSATRRTSIRAVVRSELTTSCRPDVLGRKIFWQRLKSECAVLSCLVTDPHRSCCRSGGCGRRLRQHGPTPNA